MESGKRMKRLAGRLRAWSVDAQTGRSIIGVDRDLKQAAQKLDEMEELMRATEEMIAEYYCHSVGNQESTGLKMALAVIEKIKGE
jgi:hypothetical protein